MNHAGPDHDLPTFFGELDPTVDHVTVTDGRGEYALMPVPLFEDTYSRFGWVPVPEQDDPQWPTQDPDDTGRGPFDAYLPVKETS